MEDKLPNGMDDWSQCTALKARMYTVVEPVRSSIGYPANGQLSRNQSNTQQSTTSITSELPSTVRYPQTESHQASTSSNPVSGPLHTLPGYQCSIGRSPIARSLIGQRSPSFPNHQTTSSHYWDTHVNRLTPQQQSHSGYQSPSVQAPISSFEQASSSRSNDLVTLDKERAELLRKFCSLNDEEEYRTALASAISSVYPQREPGSPSTLNYFSDMLVTQLPPSLQSHSEYQSPQGLAPISSFEQTSSSRCNARGKTQLTHQFFSSSLPFTNNNAASEYSSATPSGFNGFCRPSYSQVTQDGEAAFKDWNGKISNYSRIPPEKAHCDDDRKVASFFCCMKYLCSNCIQNHLEHLYLSLTDKSTAFMPAISSMIDSVKRCIDVILTFERSAETDKKDLKKGIKDVFDVKMHMMKNDEHRLNNEIDQKHNEIVSRYAELKNLCQIRLNELNVISENINKNDQQSDIYLNMKIAHVIQRSHVQKPTERYLYYEPNIDANLGSITISDTKKPISVKPNGRRSLRPPIYNHRLFANGTHNGMQNNKNMINGNMTNGNGNLSNVIRGIGQCISLVDHTVIANQLILCSCFGVRGQDAGEFSNPWGICSDIHGNIIIADRRNHRIQKFTAAGQFLFLFGCEGSNDGEFKLPAGVTVDIHKRIIVADKDNNRVQIFSEDGKYLQQFGKPGQNLGEFYYPWDVATNSLGHIVVSDSRNKRIQLFTSNGDFLTHFDFASHSNPRGVCFTHDGDIIVSDFELHILYKIDYKLEILKDTVGGHARYASGFLNRPSGICCDDMGNIIIANAKNHCITVLDKDLKYLSQIQVNSQDCADDSYRPADVSLLPDGKLVVLYELPPKSNRLDPNKLHIEIYG